MRGADLVRLCVLVAVVLVLALVCTDIPDAGRSVAIVASRRVACLVEQSIDQLDQRCGVCLLPADNNSKFLKSSCFTQMAPCDHSVGLQRYAGLVVEAWAF